MPAPIYWTGKLTDCQVSCQPFDGVMYDARLPGLGCWANINHDTFVALGGRLGTGLGQKYEQQPDGRWLKVEG